MCLGELPQVRGRLSIRAIIYQYQFIQVSKRVAVHGFKATPDVFKSVMNTNNDIRTRPIVRLLFAC